MMLAYVIYLPLYAIYQLVVLVLMCVYVTNKSSSIAAASHITPIAGVGNLSCHNALHVDLRFLCFMVLSTCLS